MLRLREVRAVDRRKVGRRRPGASRGVTGTYGPPSGMFDSMTRRGRLPNKYTARPHVKLCTDSHSGLSTCGRSMRAVASIEIAERAA